MTVFQAIALGIIQGLTEFLPVSSSAHLALTPWLLGWEAPGLAFDVALHTGTLAAVLWYFRRDWADLARAAWATLARRRADTLESRRLGYIVIATIPGGLAGLLLDDIAETHFRAPALIASLMMAMGIVLWLVDWKSSQLRSLEEMRWTDAVVIGLAQVVALLPGVSRSGATISAGLATGFDRASAARFSFLMSMPITLAAIVLKMPDAVAQRGLDAPLFAGILASGISGWLAISVLLRYVSGHTYGVFAIYRLVVGALVLIVVAARG
ncbi:MAG: undecaprenyl-diphosphatase UppP [Gemmatimonadaceae bacterium]